MSTRTTILTIIWASTSAWYYGYHISELNYPAESLSCYTPSFPPNTVLPICLDLTKELYGFITAIFTAGGLVGSLVSSWVTRKYGMREGMGITAWVNLLGAGLMAGAPHWSVLAFGRFVAGISSGISICILPPYLSHLAKSSPTLSSRSGQIGTMMQMAIVLGICSAQLAGLALTGKRGEIPGSWRYVVALPGILSIIQIFTGPLLEEDEDTNAMTVESAEVYSEDVETAMSASELEQPVSPLLLPSDSPTTSLLPKPPTHPSQPHPHPQTEHLPLRTILSTPALRTPTILCASILILQQFSGVNAVLFYSTPVLRTLLPTGAGVLGVGITVINALMTLPAVFLVDRVGRKPLLLGSILGMGITSFLLGYGLDNHHPLLSGVAVISFIASFAVGFGPIPFLLISELVPLAAIPQVSSLSLSLSWISNFLIALLFLPIRDFLSSPIREGDAPGAKREGEGRVFYLFTLVLGGALIVVWRGLQGRG